MGNCMSQGICDGLQNLWVTGSNVCAGRRGCIALQWQTDSWQAVVLAGRCGAIMKQWLVMGQMLETVPLLCDWDVLVGQWIRMLGKPLPTIFSWKRSFVDPGLHGIIEWLRLEGTLKTLSSSNPSAVGWVPPTSSGCPGPNPWPWAPLGASLHNLG